MNDTADTVVYPTETHGQYQCPIPGCIEVLHVVWIGYAAFDSTPADREDCHSWYWEVKCMAEHLLVSAGDDLGGYEDTKGLTYSDEEGWPLIEARVAERLHAIHAALGATSPAAVSA